MSASPSRAPPGLGPPPGLGAGTSNSASRTSSHTSNSSGSPSRGRPSRWTAGTGQPNDNVSVAADGSVVLDGVSPAEEESAANVGASPSLGGRTGLTELMEAIEDIDAAIEGSDNENKDGDAGEDGAGGDDVPDDDFLNPTSKFSIRSGDGARFHYEVDNNNLTSASILLGFISSRRLVPPRSRLLHLHGAHPVPRPRILQPSRLPRLLPPSTSSLQTPFLCLLQTRIGSRLFHQIFGPTFPLLYQTRTSF